MTRLTTGIVLASCWLLGSTGSAAQTYFTEVTEQAMRSPMIPARGAAFGDYDNDGWVDLFLSEGLVSDQGTAIHRMTLLHNEGNSTFTDHDSQFRATLTGVARGAGPVFGDYDNDGDLDLFVPVGSITSFNQVPSMLLTNDHGVFTNVSRRAGIDQAVPANSAIWLDYDRDGYLDLYVGHWFDAGNGPQPPNTLYHNQGNGTFVDATQEAGLAVYLSRFGGTDGGTAAADFNGDGWPDLYLGADLDPNRLFLNTGHGGFVDATTTELADPGDAFGVAVGDIDNDGDLDLFQAAGAIGRSGRSLLLLNLGSGQFLDVTESAGLGVLGNAETRGAGMTDVDNDGDLDLVVAAFVDSLGIRHKSALLLLNDGSVSFHNRSEQCGIRMHPGENAIYDDLWGVSLADYDNDGFVDVMVGESALFGDQLQAGGLYRNTGNGNHWLRVELTGIRSNRCGIGARLMAVAGGLTQVREVLGGLGRYQDEMVAHFGLGSHQRVDRLEIHWPSGQVDVYRDLPADQRIRCIEGEADYQTVAPTVWVEAPPDSLVAGSAVTLAAAVRPVLLATGSRVTGVSARLWDLGGPTNTALSDRGSGIYGLSADLTVKGPNGRRLLPVTIEQQTPQGLRWVQLTRTLTVLPAADLALFAEGETGGWSVRGELAANLTRHPATDTYPTWSPDGTRIAFTSNRDGNQEIYIENLDGSNPVDLTRSPNQDWWPAWSPDGSRIAFSSERGGQIDVYAMDPDGGNLVQVTHDGTAHQPTWSPDGRKIAYRTTTTVSDIWVVNVDGTDPVNLTNSATLEGQPAWSPDGQRISFCTNRDGNYEIYAMDADGSNPVNLSNNEAGDYRSAWSPDGKRIAFQSWRADGAGDIYVMDANGSNLLRLTDHPSKEDWPAWSPDGARLAFTSARDGNVEVYVMPLDNKNKVMVDPAMTTIAYEGNRAIGVSTAGEWNVLCEPGKPQETVGYLQLHFAFHPGDVAAAPMTYLQVTVNGRKVELLASVPRIELASRAWQVVEIPLALFGSPSTIKQIAFTGNLEGTFYLDDLRLLTTPPANTAVFEESVALPQAFSLAQNYPNPFNSSTAIHFSLPQDGEVDLAIYNLAGQRVAVLAHGMHEAGTYSLAWDGRGEAGRVMASGVYICRLRAGEQEDRRKMLVLR